MSTYVLGVYTDQDTADAATAALTLMPADMAANVYCTQGSYRPASNYSADTHSGGGALDISRFRRDGREWTWDELCQIATYYRMVGFAAWPRERIEGLWERHVHMERVGCGDASPGARSQWADYKAGRNGLAGGGADTGNRDYTDVTWESFHAAHPYVLEDIMASLAEVEAMVSRLLDQKLASRPDTGRVKDLHAQASGFNGTNAGEAARMIGFFREAARLGAQDEIRGDGVKGAADPNVNGVADVRKAVTGLSKQVAALPGATPQDAPPAGA